MKNRIMQLIVGFFLVCPSLGETRLRGDEKRADNAKTDLKQSKDLLKKKDVEFLAQSIEKLGNEDQLVREETQADLVELGELAVPAMIKALKNKNPKTRAGAARVLNMLSGTAAPAVSALIDALDDEDKFVRISVVAALGRIGEPKTVVPYLVRVFDNSKEWDGVRDTAVSALEFMGGKATEATAVLLEYVKDKKKPARYRAFALRALPKIVVRPKDLVPILKTVLADRDERVLRPGVAQLLGEIRCDGKSVLPMLIDMLKEADGEKDPKYAYSLRLGATFGIWGYGPEAKDAVPALIKLLEENAPRKRGADDKLLQSTLSCFAAIGPAAKEAVPVLEKLIADNPQPLSLKEQAQMVLQRIRAKKQTGS